MTIFDFADSCGQSVKHILRITAVYSESGAAVVPAAENARTYPDDS